MGRRGLLIGVFGTLMVSGEAHALPQEHLTRARSAIKSEDYRSARHALDAAYEAFAYAEGVAPNEILANYWFYRGVLFGQRDKSNQAMDAFRQALVVDRQFEWDRELNDDRELRKVFEALRGEVGFRDTISPKLPPKMGCAQAYVDGSRVSGSDEVAVGLRLAQVQCPHGDVYGTWTEFTPDAPVEWLGLCPYPVDTTIELVDAPKSDSEFEGMDVAFGEEEREVANPCLEIMAQAPPVVAAVEDTGSKARPKKQKKESSGGYLKSTFGRDSWTMPRMVTVGAGGALITSGIIVHFVGVVPAYDMVEWGRRNPTGLTRYQADVLTDRFRSRRTVSVSLTTTGVVAAAVGIFVLKPKATGVQPLLLPNGLGMQGRF